MQIQTPALQKLKQSLKAEYPNAYALKIVEKLRHKGTPITKQQAYNFFNGIASSQSTDIINATIELIQEARTEREKLEEWINNNL